MESYVYLLTNKHNNVLYTGVTNNLIRRINEHKNKLVKGFTQKYNVDRLVYYEVCSGIIVAIERESKSKDGREKSARDDVGTSQRHPEHSKGAPESGSVPGSLRSFATFRMTYLRSTNCSITRQWNCRVPRITKII
ncbi:GIY-YIG nuclease family protein [Legionella quinlivanii]|uniref:GIY-YIG nuclease family protein n=1 Tax=Legionella quinlivanii TaxID=45073 RepID=UPI000DD460FC